jgi:hypothetical protein
MLTTLHGKNIVLQCDKKNESRGCMKNKKRRRYEAYSKVKSHQVMANIQSEVVHDTFIDDLFFNEKDHLVNKKRRTKVGYVQGRKIR